MVRRRSKLSLLSCFLSYFLIPFAGFFGGGPAQEEETILEGDDVIVELDASLEDLYMGVQALVGFEKTIEHLDEHLVDISFKASANMTLLDNLKEDELFLKRSPTYNHRNP